MDEKVSWRGRVIAVQPRIRLTRSFDERSHTYLGYALRMEGIIGDREEEFLVGVGKAAQKKYEFRAGDFISGQSHPVADSRKEPVEFYKTSAINVTERGPLSEGVPPPWTGVPPELTVYRERGHRRLYSQTYEKKCRSCIWGCRMPVELIIDHWNPQQKRYRFETFCYGPKSCSLYRAGPARKVPGRKGMSYTEEDWVDEDATAHRGPDD